MDDHHAGGRRGGWESGLPAHFRERMLIKIGKYNPKWGVSFSVGRQLILRTSRQGSGRGALRRAMPCLTLGHCLRGALLSDVQKVNLLQTSLGPPIATGSQRANPKKRECSQRFEWMW